MQTELLTDVIEQNAELEAHFGIRLQNLFAHIARNEHRGDLDATVLINGELAAAEGERIGRDIHVVVSLHDDAGRVIATWRTEVGQSGFVAMQAFSISEYGQLPRVRIAKIKVYPQGV